MRTPSLAHAVLALAALAAGACSSLDQPPAATVNGVEISAAEVDDELTTIRDNDAYREALESQSGPIAGASQGTFSTSFAAGVVQLQVYFEILEQALAERDAEVSEDAMAEAREAVEAQFGQLGEEVLEGFGDDYRERLARQQALVATANEVVLEEEGLGDPEAYFEEHPDEFAEVCASHILVAAGDDGIDEATAEAGRLAARLAGGADFAALATAESDDGETAPGGGALGCGPQGTFLFLGPDVDAAAAELEVGEVSGPVVSATGVHLVTVTGRTVPAFDDVADQVEQVLAGQGQQLFNEFVLEAFCDADVDVNPRYGSWDTSGCDGQLGLPVVEPPEGPTTTTTAFDPGAVPDDGLDPGATPGS